MSDHPRPRSSSFAHLASPPCATRLSGSHPAQQIGAWARTGDQSRWIASQPTVAPETQRWTGTTTALHGRGWGDRIPQDSRNTASPRTPHGKAAVVMAERAVVVSIEIQRTPSEVWADVRDIASHVTWMQDAVAIDFLGEEREGVGVRFRCRTRVGPFSLTDLMETTSWEEARQMGVRHVGLVVGTGEFTLRDLPGGRTEFRWQEDLSFPWFLGGAIGGFLARPVPRGIWRGNLRRLKARPVGPSATGTLGR